MKKGDKLYRAWVETRRFEFEGYGVTEREAIETCYQAWQDHCAQLMREQPKTCSIDPDAVRLRDISAYEVTLGVTYRDREPIILVEEPLRARQCREAEEQRKYIP